MKTFRVNRYELLTRIHINTNRSHDAKTRDVSKWPTFLHMDYGKIREKDKGEQVENPCEGELSRVNNTNVVGIKYWHFLNIRTTGLEYSAYLCFATTETQKWLVELQFRRSCLVAHYMHA